MRTNKKFPWVHKHNDIIVKLYNWMDYPKNQFARNVEAFDLNGNSLWIIEALNVYPGEDCYTDVSTKGDSLHAFSFSCYDCLIDEKSGKIIFREFTK